jgi:hypothetical protein
MAMVVKIDGDKPLSPPFTCQPGITEESVRNPSHVWSLRNGQVARVAPIRSLLGCDVFWRGRLRIDDFFTTHLLPHEPGLHSFALGLEPGLCIQTAIEVQHQ